MNNILSDQDFFELYLKSVAIIYSTLDEVVFIKNANLKFCYVSPTYLRGYKEGGNISKEVLLGLDEPKQTKTTFDEAILNQDIEIKSNLKPAKFLYIDIYNKIGIIHKQAIINPDTNNFVGIFCHVSPLALPSVVDMLYKINGINDISCPITAQSSKYELTQRQHEVLFLYINRYSASEVAVILSALGKKITVGRINDILQNLKFIFWVNTKEELIKKAISLKYHLLLPRSFLQVGSFPFEEELLISEI